jgi:predicted ATPase
VEEHCAQLAEDHQFVHAAGVSAWPDHTLAARYRFVHALYQELWHERVSTSRLQEWHRRIGERKEAAYGSHAGEIAAELAVHFAQGRDLPRALRYLQQAGEQALQRNAYAESIHHLRQALAYLNALPEGLQRAQHELQLQATLGVPLLCTRGYAASEVERAYSRAYQLCQQVGETPRLFPIVFGLFRFYLVRGDVPTARTLGEQLLRLAQQGPTPLLLPAAYAAAGGSLFHLGEIASARALVGQGHALYEQPQQEALVPVHGDDAGVVCLSFAAWALWLLGYPDQALAKSHAAFTLAQTSPYTFVRATNCVALAYCLAWSRELQALQACAETALAYSVEQGFPHFIGNFTIFQGWACAMQGNPAVGLAHIRQGLALYHTMGTGLYTPYFLSLLAEAYGKAGQVKAGLAALAKAFALMHTTEERWCEPELYRLQGEITLQQAGLRCHASRLWTRPTATIPPTQAHTASTDAEAEACFLKAIDIARRQQARSWELCATVSLARLWQRQGKDHAARTMLSDLYAWFTEGWETADLQEAQALLDALSHHR